MEKTIYLAGGCFWGLEKYLQAVHGVTETEVGYANGNGESPGYHDIPQTGHAETVKVTYDPNRITLAFLLDIFYEAIDPTSYQRQGNDAGVQYRTGIYYADQEDQNVVLESIIRLQNKTEGQVMIEVLPLKNYSPAEEYHQEYLDKNPGGYCHIRPAQIKKSSRGAGGSLSL